MAETDPLSAWADGSVKQAIQTLVADVTGNTSEYFVAVTNCPGN